MSRNKADGNNAGGFALILVVWLLVLIGAIGTYLVTNGRAETAVAYNIHAAASAEALADAGIARIVFNQSDPEIANRWKLDGTSHRISVPAGMIMIRPEDESQKINPNLASDTLLAALFEVSGVERSAARSLGAAVADWVSPASPAQAGGDAKPDPYRAAGRSYSAPHAPLESLDELQLVLGMTPEILASVRPYLTIYTHAAAPDKKNASRLVQRAIALADQASDDAQTPNNAPAPTTSPAPNNAPQAVPAPAAQLGAAPQAAASDDDGPLIAADITARSREGGVFVRHAVLQLKSESATAYSVLDWQRGALDDAVAGKVSD